MSKLKAKLLSYKTTLLSPIMLFFITIHTLEDLSLLTIGKYAPLPTPLMYAFGLLFSWIIMSGVVHRYFGHLHHGKSNSTHEHDIDSYDSYR